MSNEEELLKLLLVATLRLYDVNMALLTDKDPEVAQALLEAHMNGNILGPEPDFSGVFATNALNNHIPPDRESLEED